MPTTRQNIFVKMLVMLFRAEQTVEDLFFRDRTMAMIESLIQAHVQYCSSGEDVRSRAGRLYVQSFKDAQALLEEMRYLKKGETGALAIAHEWTLSYLLDVLLEARPKPEEKRTVQPTESIQPVRPQKNKVSGNSEKILEFVRRTPECRTKEIVDEFSALSSRTIIRCLNELGREGLILKKSEHRAVYYSAT